jgi:hypothetical protein
MTSPKNWGKHFWATIHVTALGYPDEPSSQNALAYKTFYLSFGEILPCQKCRKNFKDHLKELPMERALKNRDALFDWTVRLHNIVNRDLHRSEWTIDYAKEFYLSGSYNSFHKNDQDVVKADIWRMVLMTIIILNIIVIIFLMFVYSGLRPA